jgi:hypothetical protein
MALRKGRHSLPGRSQRPGIRVITGTLAGICAAVVAITLILTNSAGQAVRTATTTHPRALPHVESVQVTSAEREQLHHYMTVPGHRAEISSLMERSFKQAGLRTGTTSVEVPGRPSLDLAYGVTGEHVWVTASFNDVYDGAVAAMTSGCVALMGRYGLSSLNWMCGWMGAVLSDWAAGHAWAASHGVWIAVYWWPWIYYQGGYW